MWGAHFLASSAPVPIIAGLAVAAVGLGAYAVYQRRSPRAGRSAGHDTPAAPPPAQVPASLGPPSAGPSGPGMGPSSAPAVATPIASPPPPPAVPPPSATPPGWYSDPSGNFALRYWDGSGWSGHVTLADGSQAFDPPPAG